MISEMDFNNKLVEARRYLEERVTLLPKLGIILGSGLGTFADLVEEKVVIPYKDISAFSSFHS